MIDIKEKPFKTIDQQIEILEKRGLHIDDKEKDQPQAHRNARWLIIYPILGPSVFPSQVDR